MRKESLTIDSRAIGKGVHPFEFSPSPEDIDLDPKEFHSIGVEGTLHISSARMVVSFVANAVAVLECDRTLVEFDQEISGSFEGIVGDVSEIRIADEDEVAGAIPKVARDSSTDFSADDLVDVVPMVEGVVVLDAAVRDTLILAVPMRKISPEAAAMELQTSFGTSGNDDADAESVDPRWEALRQLKKETTGSATDSETDSAKHQADDN